MLNKSMKTKLFSLFLMLTIGIGTIFASDTQVDGIYYNFNNTTLTAEVTYQGNDRYSQYYTGIVIIPSSVVYNNQAYIVTNIGSSAFYGCTGLTSIEIPNSVTSIGERAFSGCSGLTSIDIPNSVTEIKSYAFSGCISLTSIMWNAKNYTSPKSVQFAPFLDICTQITSFIIGGDVESIPSCLCNGMRKLTKILIPNSVTSIDFGAFYDCTGLTSVTIPGSVTSIGYSAFELCSGLTSIIVEADIPPTLGDEAFVNTNNCSIYVPCGALYDYRMAWYSYYSRIRNKPLEYSIIGKVNIEGAGSIQLPQTKCDSILAIPNYGYHFVQWSDGNTDNPRSITLIQDTTFTAEFAIDKSGTCGADNLLKWSYEDKTSTLTISGKGELTQNYTFGIEAPTQMKTLVIGDDVTSIGDSAFFGMTTINHLSIGGNVEFVGNYAFAECKNFDDITCYANTVPTINATTFDNIGNKYYIYLFVPEERVRAYKRDTWWGQFDVQASSAKQTETTTVATTTTETAVEITWPSVTDAATYEVVIKEKAGNVVCTLIFDAEGKLISIAYKASSRDGAPLHTQTAGFSFTVTGLEPGTEYDLTITAKNEAGQEIDKKNSSFHTNWPNGIEDIHVDSDKPVKVLMDGQIYILRADHIFDTQGKMIR